MKDNNGHIIEKGGTHTIESWMQYVLETYQDNEFEVQYRGAKTNWYTVLSEHRWDFYANEYQIIKPREYVIAIKDGDAEIVETSSYLFDFTKNDAEYILMKEMEH